MAGEHAVRKHLPDNRQSITHKVVIDRITDLYITVGLFPDTEQPGEVFFVVGKVGSTLRGMLDLLGIQTSLLLQYGVELPDLCDKMIGVSFAPSGMTNNPDIPVCSSLADYGFRWLKLRFVERYTPPGQPTEPPVLFPDLRAHT